MLSIISVFIGGGIGSLLQYGCSVIFPSHWGTFCINVLGAFFIGLAFAYFESNTLLSPHLKSFIMAGLLGGFTTFSTYLLNFTNLANSSHLGEAFLYLSASIIVGCIFLLIGIKTYGWL